MPILAVAEKRSDIPSLLRISADLSLETGKLDRKFVADLVEVLYPDTTIEKLGLPSDSDARWLSLEDLVLAFRPGRHVQDVLHVLATLIERNRGDFEGEDGDGGGGGDRHPNRSLPPHPRRKGKDRTRRRSRRRVKAKVAGSATNRPGPK
ncbi:hypothetical protein [Hartmannibacter diazotrophicus]|uniref:hypothetical protein n=1 Tax=Hartmannibacter diazotrophicus TaxID=1482074 RepID=UPI001FE70882|nr:hypothetical protein [Hartmannibacter diazotrophicus]